MEVKLVITIHTSGKKTTNYDYYRVTCTDNRGVNTVFPNDGDLIVLVEQQHVLLLRQMIHWKLM